MKKSIEIEIRTFISQNQYRNLEKKLLKRAKFVKEINDQTIYFKAPQDLRIRKDQDFSYLILKEGKIHQNSRKEIEIKLKREDFKKIESLLTSLGFKPEIYWYRNRKIFDWENTKVYLDSTRGYGKILELEEFGKETDKEKIFNKLKQKLKMLGIKKITAKNEFNKKFQYYKKNWRKILNL